jgi:asparagine synthetase B (glutamine-hydrolysing)
VLRCSATSFSVEEYWRLRVTAPLDTDPDDPEVPKALLGHLETAVRRRVAGIRQVGAQVSGGLDSSGVTAIAHATRDPESSMFAYTIRRHDWQGQLLNQEEQQLASLLGEELPGVVRRVVNQHRAHRPYFLYQRRYLERPLPDMVFFLNTHDRLLEAARQDGCGVMLTGWGGDEMVSSRTQLHVLAMLTERRWRPAFRNLNGQGGWWGPLLAAWSHVARPLLGAVPRARWSAASDEQVRRIFANKPLASLVAPARWSTGRASVRHHRIDALYRTGNTLMLEVQDWLGQRAGIAGVHPLFDRDVVSFANRLPAEWIADRQIRRRAFRTALIPVLSDAHRLRDKVRRPGRGSRALPGSRVRLLMERALDDLARSDSWLHEFVNLAALAEATRADTGDLIAQIGAGVLVVARART